MEKTIDDPKRQAALAAPVLAAQDDDAALKADFTLMAKAMGDNESKIMDELNAAQGKPVDLGGYFHQDQGKREAAMRPSPTFNTIIDGM